MDLLKRIPAYGLYGLLIYMPLHIFLSQSLSLLTGGLDVWKIGKDLVLFFLVLLSVFLVFQQNKVTRVFKVLFVLTVGYCVIHLFIWALHPDIYAESAMVGTIFNTRLAGFLLLGYAAATLTPELVTHKRVVMVMLGISTIVATLGVIQYFLPQDILTNVGYSIERGVKPSFAIDDKSDLPRIMSTLRDPNSLGAYLLLPITFIIGSLLEKSRKSLMLAGMLGIHLLALFLTFSRAAWVGLIIILGFIALSKGRSLIEKYRTLVIGGVMCASLVLGLAFILRDNYIVQNIIFHSDENTTAELDSNERHLNYAVGGLRAIVTDPLGYGPGTAGIVSINNPGGGLLTENYYVQIAHEVSILGLIVFIALVVYVLRRLLQSSNLLSYSLAASMVAYIVMSFVMHLWSNEAVAAQWWLLAGVTLALPQKRTTKA